MTEEVQMFMEEAKEAMEHSIQHLENELIKVRAGKSNPSMLNGLNVDYYGTMSPLSQVSNVSTPDARTLLVKPWEKAMLEPIEKAILSANIGLTPMNDGEQIRISIPPLTEERRKELVKQIKYLAEESKISIRSARRVANEGVKTLLKEGLSEDQEKTAEHDIQTLTNEFNVKVDNHIERKEKEIMTV